MKQEDELPPPLAVRFKKTPKKFDTECGVCCDPIQISQIEGTLLRCVKCSSQFCGKCVYGFFTSTTNDPESHGYTVSDLPKIKCPGCLNETTLDETLVFLFGNGNITRSKAKANSEFVILKVEACQAFVNNYISYSKRYENLLISESQCIAYIEKDARISHLVVVAYHNFIIKNLNIAKYNKLLGNTFAEVEQFEFIEECKNSILVDGVGSMKKSSFETIITTHEKLFTMTSPRDGVNVDVCKVMDYLISILHKINKLVKITENASTVLITQCGGKGEVFGKCPWEKCSGLLISDPGSSLVKCAMCPVVVCIQCDSKFETGHICDEKNVKSVQQVIKTTKPCPVCATRIVRRKGCEDMFCTSCKTCFNWVTLKINERGNTNPHYADYVKKQNKLIIPVSIISRFNKMDPIIANGEDGLSIKDRIVMIHRMLRRLIVQSNRSISTPLMDQIIPQLGFFDLFTDVNNNIVGPIMIGAPTSHPPGIMATMRYLLNDIDKQRWEHSIISIVISRFLICEVFSKTADFYQMVFEKSGELINECTVIGSSLIYTPEEKVEKTEEVDSRIFKEVVEGVLKLETEILAIRTFVLSVATTSVNHNIGTFETISEGVENFGVKPRSTTILTKNLNKNTINRFSIRNSNFKNFISQTLRAIYKFSSVYIIPEVGKSIISGGGESSSSQFSQSTFPYKNNFKSSQTFDIYKTLFIYSPPYAQSKQIK